MSDWLAAPERALLIGINEYDVPPTIIRPLQGSVHDAKAMAALLRERLGLPEDRLKLLLSPADAGAERPTRAAILAAIRDWLGAAPPGSDVLLYYSGHGSRNRLAPELAFGDQQGEALVPCDARVGGVRDLLDRELRVLYRELADAGIRLTLIVDSCHAGGSWRGDAPTTAASEPVARTVADDVTPRTLASLLDGQVSAEQLRATYDAEIEGLVALGAAQPTQKAYELPQLQPDGATEVSGAMTRALLATLREAAGALTAIDLARGTLARMPPSLAAKQKPLVQGDWDRLLFRPERLSRAQPLYVVSQLNGDGSIVVDAGSSDGVDLGAMLTVWPDWSLAGKTSRWRVASVAAQSATAVAAEGDTATVGQPVRIERAALPTVRFGTGRATLGPAWRGIANGTVREVRSDKSDYLVTQAGDEWLIRRGEALRRRAAASRFEPYETLRALNRIACYDSFMERRPTMDQTLALPVGPDARGGLRLLAEWVVRYDDHRPADFGAESAAAGPNWQLQITLRNESRQKLYVMLYRAEPATFRLEGVWPQERPNELESGVALTVKVMAPEGGRFCGRLIVSSQDIPFPRYPCGRPDATRGDAPRDVTGFEAEPSRRGEGWAVCDVTIGVAP